MANQAVEAIETARFGEAALVDIPEGGYRDFVARGIENLQARIAAYTPALK